MVLGTSKQQVSLHHHIFGFLSSVMPSFVLLSVCLCLAAPLSPRRVHALSTKLSDRDVRAIMVFLGRRLQELRLGTPVIEGIACLR